MVVLFQKMARRIELLQSPITRLRNYYFKSRGARIGHGTVIPTSVSVTWPHQLSLGSECVLQSNIFFNYDHFWTEGPSIVVGDRVFIGHGCEFNIRSHCTIGNDCLIASGVKLIDHDHGHALGSLIREQVGQECPITIGNDVWLGANAVVLKGVFIADGAVIGAGAVVTKAVPANEIWCGVPARKVGIRAITQKI